MKSPNPQSTVAVLPKKVETKEFHLTWKYFGPIVTAAVLALIPPPAALQQHAWYYFALFAGVIVDLMFEPVPGGAIGAIGVTLATLLAPWVLYGPRISLGQNSMRARQPSAELSEISEHLASIHPLPPIFPITYDWCCSCSVPRTD
jgi:di/tricarboxylate transporter